MGRLSGAFAGVLLLALLATPPAAQAEDQVTPPAPPVKPEQQSIVRDDPGDAQGATRLRADAEVLGGNYSLPRTAGGRMRVAIRFKDLRETLEAEGRKRIFATTILTTGRAAYEVRVSFGLNVRGRVLRIDESRTTREDPEQFRVIARDGRNGLLIAQLSTEWVDGNTLRFRSTGHVGRYNVAYDGLAASERLRLSGTP